MFCSMRSTTIRAEVRVNFERHSSEQLSAEAPTLRGYVAAFVVVLLATCVNELLAVWFAPTNLAMVYLLGVVLVATRFSRGPSVFCALVGVVAFDFFFVPPIFTFRFGDTQYL